MLLKRALICSWVLAVLIVASFPAGASPVVLIDEDFEGVAVGTKSAGTVIGEFTVSSGSVDVVGTGFFGELCVLPTAGNCVDMEGSSPGAIASTLAFTLAAGTEVTLSFDLIGSQRGSSNDTLVTFGAAFSETFTRASGDAPPTVVRIFTLGSAQTASLTFADVDGGSFFGAMLDNVTLAAEAPSSVPLPGTATLMAVGLAALLGFTRHRSRRP
jgi:hypothetical protein